MNPQSFAKSPGHFLAKQTARILCWCAFLAFASTHASAATSTWNATAADAAWTTGSNWSPSSVPTSADDVLINAGGSAISLSGTSATIQFLTFNGTSSRTLQNSVVSTSANLTFSATGASGNLINVNPASGAPTFTIQNGSGTLRLLLGANGNINVNGASDGTVQLTLNSNITESGGSRTLVKTGNGVLSLGGTNSYTGGTTLRGGYITLTSSTALPTSGAITIGDNTASAVTNTARLQFDTGSGGTYSNNISFVRNGQTQPKSILVRNSAGTVTLSGNITITNDVVFQTTTGNTLNLTGKISGSTVSNALTLQGNTGTVTISNEANDFNTSNSMIVSRGTLLLRGNDTGTSGIFGVGTGPLAIGNNSLANENAQILTDGAYTIARAINMNQGAASSTNTLGGNTSDTSTFSGNIALASGSNTSFRLTAATNGTVNFTGVISGTATNGLSKIGNGRAVLSGANTFTGGVTINAGTLQLGNASALNSTAGSENAINFGASSTGALSLNGTSVVISSLSSNATPGTPVVQNANAAAATLTVGNSANATSSYTGVIQDGTGGGALSLTKAGTGTLTLSGSNTYNGTTTINAGTLTISNNTALGSTVGGTTIASGASLNLQGTITVAEALTHNGGTSGYLRNVSGNNAWNGDITIGAASSRIRSDAGLLTIGGNITMTQAPIFEGAGNISITGVVSGSNNFTMGANMAGGVLTLSGNNTYTGGTMVNAGTLSVSSINNQSTSGVVGNNTTQIYLGGATTNGTLLYTGTGVTTNRKIRVGGANGQTDTGNAIIRNDGSGALVFSNAAFNQVTANTTANRTLTLGGTNTALNTIQGAIVDNTASTGLVGLTKVDAGTWVLSGNNTYTGATTISAGTLQFAKAASLYNGIAASWTKSNITVNSGATLALNVGGTGEFTTGNVTTILGLATSINNNGLRGGSQIAFDTTNAAGGTFIINDNIVNSSGTGNGTLGLVKLGANTLTLNGTNTYTGNTTVSAGVLSIASTSALPSWSTNGSYSVASGASLAVYNAVTDANITTILGTTNFAAGSAIGFDTTTADRTYSATLGNTAQGALGLTKVGSNTLILTANNTYTANTTISGGTLQVGAGSTAGALGSGAVVNNAALVFNRSDNITVANNISGTGSLTQNASSILTLNGTNTYSGLTNISGNGVIDVGTISNNAIPSGSGILLGSSTAASGIYGILQGNGNLTRSLSGSVTPVSGQISGAAGGFAARGGQLTITFGNNASTELGLNQAGYAFGNNFVFGSSTADSKVLLQNNINLGSSSPRNITVNAGVGGDAATSVEFSGVIRNLASTGIAQINKNGDGMLILSNASNSFNGSVSINNGTISVNSINSVGGGNSVLGAPTTAAQGTIALGSTTSTGRLLYTGSGDTTDRVINLQGTTGGGIIDQSGLGTLKFTSNFTATGAGSKTLTLQGSTAGIGEISGAVVNNNASNTTSLTKNGTGTWVLSGVNTYTGATTINAGTLSIAAITNGTVAGALGNSTNAAGNLVLGGGTLEYTGSANGATDRNFTLTAGTISGISVTNSIAALTISGTSATTSGALTKAGSGTLILSGNNTYSGGTTINAGTLEIASTGRLGGGNYSASVTNNGTFIYSGANSQTLSGVISGTGALTQNGSGMLTLNNAGNTYSGATTVNAGTLNLASSLTGSAITVNSGGALIGTATAGTVTVNSGAFIGAGNAAATPGTLTVGSLTLNGGSTYTWDLGNVIGTAGTNWDLLSVTNALTINATSGNKFTVAITGTPTGWAPSTSQTWNIMNYGSLANAFDATVFDYTTILSGAGTWSFTNNSTSKFIGLTYTVSSTSTWNGGSENWSSGFSTVPVNGNALVFSGAGGTATNDIASGNLTSLTTITINSTAGSYTLAANSGSSGFDASTPLTITGVTNNSANATTVNLALAVNNSALAINAAAGNITMGGPISNNNTITFSGANSAIVNGAISGTGAIVQNGSGRLMLNGTNTYTGSTTINAGTLSISTMSNGGVAGALGNSTNAASNLVLGGGTLEYTGSGNSTDRNFTLTAGTTSTISVTNSSAALTISGTSATTNGALTKAGSGTLILSGNNAYSGGTTLSAGTLQIGHANALGSSGTITLGGGTLQYGTGITTDLSSRFSTASSQAYNIDTNGNNVTYASALTSSSGTLTKTGSGTLTLSGTNTYNGTTTINAGTLLLSSGGAGTPVLSSSSAIINNSTLSFDAPTWNVTYANTINGTGNVTHAMSVAGRRVSLTGTNSYSGGTFVSNDVLLGVNADNNLGATIGALTLGNGTTGGALRIDQTGFTSANRSIILAGTASGSTANKLAINVASGTASFGGNISGSGNLDLTGSAYSAAPGGTGTVVFTLSGNNTYTGATSISNNVTVRAGSSTALGNNSAVTLQGTGSTLDLNNNNLTIGSLASSVSSNVTLGNRTLTTGADNTSTSFAGVLAGSGGGLTKTGTGTLTLSGINTYTGATTISAGNLSISSAAALGSTSGVNLADATALIYNGSAATLDRAISVTGGTGTIRNSGTGLLTLSGALSKNGTTLTLAGGGNGITVEGVISGSANNSDLVIDGGTTTLTNANNSYNGPTFIINGGTLNANTAGALPTSTLSAVTINGSSTLALGASQSVASLSGTSGSTVNLNASTLTINGSATTTYSGGISGTGNLVKNGSGTQTLAGATTFNGTTTVNSGTLKADAANALANTSQVVLNNGGSFLVTADDAVNDNAAIHLNGGRMAMSGNFNETVGALTLSANSTLDFSGFVGTLRFSGIGSWASGANLAIWNWSGRTEYGTNYGTYPNSSNLVFTNNSTLSSNLANISFYSDSGTTSIGSGFERGFTGGGTEIIAVPEPETYITAVALLLGVTFYQIRLARHGQGLLARLTFLRRRAKRKPLGGSSSRMTQISSTEGL